MVDHPPATATPLTPRCQSSTSCCRDVSLVSPQSVRMLSPRRYTLDEMHRSLCMLDQTTLLLDCPPLLPARHDSIHRSYHGSDDDDDDDDDDNDNDGPLNRCIDENHGFDIPPLTPSRIRSNSRDNIVHVLLPNSPNNTRASFTFSRLVSDLPRAGASRTRSIGTSTGTSEPIGANARMKARIFPYKSG
jgi:hypothetical protein